MDASQRTNFNEPVPEYPAMERRYFTLDVCWPTWGFGVGFGVAPYHVFFDLGPVLLRLGWLWEPVEGSEAA